MKNIQIILCTPDMFRPTARSCINSIKQTDLSKAELIIADNAYDNHFSHPKLMASFFSYVENRQIIFVDDDVQIHDYDWIDRLISTSNQTKSTIVGCIHTYESGEINHHGILVYRDGTTELMREPIDCNLHNPYVPAVSSAVMLIKDINNLGFDTTYKKYQHDTDICLSAWQKNKKVSLCSELKVVHKLSDYTSTFYNFKSIYAYDSQLMANKWIKFCENGLYDLSELKCYQKLSEGPNWEEKYNKASILSETDPQKAAVLFNQIINECPQSWRRAGAHYHLFGINNNEFHLSECIKLNPYHKKASDLISAEKVEINDASDD
jgi:hypothetical protein